MILVEEKIVQEILIIIIIIIEVSLSLSEIDRASTSFNFSCKSPLKRGKEQRRLYAASSFIHEIITIVKIFS